MYNYIKLILHLYINVTESINRWTLSKIIAALPLAWSSLPILHSTCVTALLKQSQLNYVSVASCQLTT